MRNTAGKSFDIPPGSFLIDPIVVVDIVSHLRTFFYREHGLLTSCVHDGMSGFEKCFSEFWILNPGLGFPIVFLRTWILNPGLGFPIVFLRTWILDWDSKSFSVNLESWSPETLQSLQSFSWYWPYRLIHHSFAFPTVAAHITKCSMRVHLKTCAPKICLSLASMPGLVLLDDSQVLLVVRFDWLLSCLPSRRIGAECHGTDGDPAALVHWERNRTSSAPE